MTPDTNHELTASWFPLVHRLIEASLPVFVAPPKPGYDEAPRGKRAEFDFPTRWQTTEPDPSTLNRWEPGWAVCLVTGHGLDAVDVDPVNGGDIVDQHANMTEAGISIVGISMTPSGGAHFYVLSTGIASAANTRTGVDYRGGREDGTGRGFLYLPGTQRPKYSGAGYEWRAKPDIGTLRQLKRGAEGSAIARYLAESGAVADASLPPTNEVPDPPAPPEAVDAHAIPPWLAELLADTGPTFKRADGTISRDRSARFHHLVKACRRAGLSQGQTVTVMEIWCGGVG